MILGARTVYLGSVSTYRPGHSCSEDPPKKNKIYLSNGVLWEVAFCSPSVVPIGGYIRARCDYHREVISLCDTHEIGCNIFSSVFCKYWIVIRCDHSMIITVPNQG